MPKVVQFLEELGRNPQSFSTADFAEVVAGAALEPAVQKALLDRDAHALNQLLGGRLTVMCMIVPAENDEPQRDDEQEGESEAPDDQASSHAA